MYGHLRMFKMFSYNFSMTREFQATISMYSANSPHPMKFVDLLSARELSVICVFVIFVVFAQFCKFIAFVDCSTLGNCRIVKNMDLRMF